MLGLKGMAWIGTINGKGIEKFSAIKDIAKKTELALPFIASSPG
jgi:hypothetical protein